MSDVSSLVISDVYAEVSLAKPEQGSKFIETLLFNDPNFDIRLKDTQSEILKLEKVPNDVQVKYWADHDGYFLYFVNTSDNQRPHHFSDRLQYLQINDSKTIDLQNRRLVIDKLLLTQLVYIQAGQEPVERYKIFEDIKSEGKLNFLLGLLSLPKDFIGAEIKLLQGLASHSHNPYFKIYSADAYTAQAVLSLLEQMQLKQTQEGFVIKLNSQETLAQLNQAIKLVREAQTAAMRPLINMGKLPSKDDSSVLLHPFGMYEEGGMYFFWAGALEQARQRDIIISLLCNAVRSGSFSPLGELFQGMPC